MTCFMFNQWKLYENGELSPSESKGLEQHAEQCPQCQRKLQEWVDHMLEEEFSAYPEVPVPDTFTDEVMSKLFEAVPARTARKHSSRTRRQRGWDIVKKTGLVVAGLTALVVTGTVVSPTFANYVNSLFQIEKDAGMRNAVHKGFAQKLNQKITDQGITFEAKELMVDSMRIAVIYDMYDQNGKQIDLDEHFLDSQLIDPTGKDLISENDGIIMAKHGNYFIAKLALNDIFESSDTTPDQLVLKIEQTEIAGKEGKWELEFPIDMKKVKEATKIANFHDAKYESPQGLVMELKKIEFSPSATRVLMETTYTTAAEEARNQQVETYKKNQEQGKTIGIKPEFLADSLSGNDIAYEITNEQGEVVAAWDMDLDKGIRNRKNVLHVSGTVAEPEGDKMKWWQTFAPIQGEQKLTFQLKKIYERKLAYPQMELVPAELVKQKETVKDEVGNTFTFSSFVLEPANGEKKPKAQAVITVEGTLGKNVVRTGFWFVKDENGKVYHSYLSETESIRDKDGHVNFKGKLEIPGMEQEPKKLTVSYADYTVEHRNVKWEVPIEIK
ncbi:DUF4179 domain-containing protein [Brevibacillus brevis]|uniref:DUF4179 domain-containing protein n=1 Tax=Brevibacillus brevis TaxID=1393 RepID=A0A2Z4MBV7_BREBE|nr:DUF4179 domain-containing protein [Brevibacillus brevis]AWX53964.1 DUF4179 domain-containing protein [Brevibacillus brevis]